MAVRRSRFEVTPLGHRSCVVRKVMNAPTRKEESETRVLVQPWGLLGRSAVLRPKITVLPVDGWSVSVSKTSKMYARFKRYAQDVASCLVSWPCRSRSAASLV